MSWLNPVALIGLFALAIPILVHLFGRRVARRQRFPSLRLLRDARPSPATRSRPSDLLLLVLRCLAIAAAVAALAQPRFTDRSGASQPARAIVVDTSTSMRRLTSGGTAALQQARDLASRMVDSSSEVLVIESDRPGNSLAGAGSWLSQRGGVREVVVVSDFQAGSIVEGELAKVPAGIGARLIRVNGSGAIATSDTMPGLITRLTPEQTSATWFSSGTDVATSVAVLAGDDERVAAAASVAAARSIAGSAGTGRLATLVFPGAPARRELLRQAAPVDSAWHGELVLSLARDPAFASAALTANVAPGCETSGAVVQRTFDELAVASVARGPDGLLVFSCVEPGGLAATALIAGLEHALRLDEPPVELEPNFLPDETLRRWERPAVESAPRGPGETSPDGRWIWLVALGLLVVEEIVRRGRPRRDTPRVHEVRHERVA